MNNMNHEKMINSSATKSLQANFIDNELFTYEEVVELYGLVKNSATRSLFCKLINLKLKDYSYGKNITYILYGKKFCGKIFYIIEFSTYLRPIITFCLCDGSDFIIDKRAVFL